MQQNKTAADNGKWLPKLEAFCVSMSKTTAYDVKIRTRYSTPATGELDKGPPSACNNNRLSKMTKNALETDTFL